MGKESHFTVAQNAPTPAAIIASKAMSGSDIETGVRREEVNSLQLVFGPALLTNARVSAAPSRCRVAKLA